MQVDVVGRLPKRDRRGCSPRAQTGLRVEAPEDLIERYPDRLIPVEAVEVPREGEPLEAAITSDVAPKPAPQPIKPPKPPRRQRKTAPKKV